MPRCLRQQTWKRATIFRYQITSPAGTPVSTLHLPRPSPTPDPPYPHPSLTLTLTLPTLTIYPDHPQPFPNPKVRCADTVREFLDVVAKKAGMSKQIHNFVYKVESRGEERGQGARARAARVRARVGARVGGRCSRCSRGWARARVRSSRPPPPLPQVS